MLSSSMRFDASRSRSCRAMKRVCNRVLKLAGIHTCDTGPCRTGGFRIRCDNLIVNGDGGEEEGEIDQTVAEEEESEESEEEEEANSSGTYNDNREYESTRSDDHFDFIWRLLEDTKCDAATSNYCSVGWGGGSARNGGDGGFHGAGSGNDSSSSSSSSSRHYYCTGASNDSYCTVIEEEQEQEQEHEEVSGSYYSMSGPLNVAEIHMRPLNLAAAPNVEEEEEEEEEEALVCPVCLEALSVPLNSPLNWRLPCGHGFHRSCLSAWTAQQQQQRSAFCPCCRAPIHVTPVHVTPIPPPPPPPPDATSLFDHVDSALAHLLRFL